MEVPRDLPLTRHAAMRNAELLISFTRALDPWPPQNTPAVEELRAIGFSILTCDLKGASISG
jgi:hypothetical protein